MNFNERKAYILIHTHRVESRSGGTHILRAWRVERFSLDKPRLIGYAITHQSEAMPTHLLHEYFSELDEVGHRLADIIHRLQHRTV